MATNSRVAALVFTGVLCACGSRSAPDGVRPATDAGADALERLLTGDPGLDASLFGAGLGSLSRWLYASLEHDLSPHAAAPSALTAAEAATLDAQAGHAVWSAGEMVRAYTRGSSTVTHNASLLVRALVTADATAAACGFAP